MAVDEQQHPLLQKGKVLVKYQLEQPHEYWVHPSSVVAVGTPEIAAKLPAENNGKSKASTAKALPAVTPEACAEAICIYTDGACSGNPGPAGIGVVLRYKEKHKEISRSLGTATNNIAELEAIRVGLLAVKNRKLPVILFSDSSYALGLLSQGWKAKKNMELVDEIRRLAATFPKLRFVKVKGHAGHPDNERADQLAVQAVNGA
ncbi:MAG: ribonuclease HI [Desulfobacterales bacterium]|nr:ribonuclease HI [Desulfobacterales bacterium]